MITTDQLIKKALISGQMVGKDGEVYRAIVNKIENSKKNSSNMKFSELANLSGADSGTCRKAVSRLSEKGYIEVRQSSIASRSEYTFKLLPLSPCGLPIEKEKLQHWNRLFGEVPKKLIGNQDFMKKLDAFFRLGGLMLARQFIKTHVEGERCEKELGKNKRRQARMLNSFESRNGGVIPTLESKDEENNNSTSCQKWEFAAYIRVCQLKAADVKMNEMIEIMNDNLIPCYYDSSVWNEMNIERLLFRIGSLRRGSNNDISMFKLLDIIRRIKEQGGMWEDISLILNKKNIPTPSNCGEWTKEKANSYFYARKYELKKNLFNKAGNLPWKMGLMDDDKNGVN